jgi:guanylate kinase
MPPSLEELELRLRERGTDSDEEVKRRLLIARDEIREVDAFHYAIVNDRVERAVAELQEVVEAERAERQGPLEARLSPSCLASEFRLELGLPLLPRAKPAVC